MKKEAIMQREMKSGAITLLDILGWKGIWQRKHNAIKDLLDIIEITTKRAQRITNREFPCIKKSRFIDLSTEVISISDTIAIVTYGECNKALEYQATVVSRIISESIIYQIPVRGATCYGELITEENIMLGPAVDEVASWYEIFDWIGVIYTPSALLQLDHDGFFSKGVIKPHSIDIKNYGKYNTFCVNWIRNWLRKKLDKNDLIKNFVNLQPITPAIASKILSTVEFYDTFEADEIRYLKQASQCEMDVCREDVNLRRCKFDD